MAKGKHASDGDLVAWDDGSIDEARRSWLAGHLADCVTCRERLIGLQEVERRIQELYPSIDDPAAQTDIVERLRAERKKRLSEALQEMEKPETRPQ